MRISKRGSKLRVALGVVGGLLFLGAVSASGEELMDTNTSWDGGRIAYPEGTPEITAKILKIAPGQALAFHCHPVPTLGYVLKGTVEVATIDGEKIVMEPGDPAVEVMRTLHRGRAVDGPVEVLVFYAGAEGVPTTVMPEDDPDHKYCDPPRE